jgi:hypothetical protein
MARAQASATQVGYIQVHDENRDSVSIPSFEDLWLRGYSIFLAVVLH